MGLGKNILSGKKSALSREGEKTGGGKGGTEARKSLTIAEIRFGGE